MGTADLPSGRLIRPAPLVILLGAPLVVYLFSLSHGFVWDDRGLVLADPWVHSLKHAGFLFSPDYWLHYFPGIKGQYRPVRALTFALQWALWGANPMPFHAFNLLLHLANVWLVYRLLDQISGRKEVAWFAALLFGLHPVNVETVAWIKNRSELLALFFSLLSLEGYLRAQAKDSAARGSALLSLSAICFVLALLSKEMAITFPLMILVYGLFLAPKRKRALGMTVPHLAITGLYLVFKFFLLKEPSAASPGHIPLGIHLLLIVKTIGTYLWLLTAPVKLIADRPLEIHRSMQGWQTFAFALLTGLALFTGAMLAAREKRHIALFGLLWVLIGLIPVANIIYLRTRPLAEQRLYYPLLGFCLLASVGLMGLLRRFPRGRIDRLLPHAAMSFMVLLASLYGIRTLSRSFVWKDDLTLIRRTLRDSPRSARPHLQMGIIHLQKGELDLAGREFLRTLDLSPRQGDAPHYLGMVYMRKKEYGQALKWLKRALAANPDSVVVLSNLALTLAELGSHDEARAAFQKALRLAPRDPRLHTDLGILYGRMGRYKEAIQAFDRALEIDPRNLRALVHRAYGYGSMGDGNRCIRDLRKALSWAPGNIPVHLDIARAYRQRGEPDLALETLRQALSLDPSDPRIHNRLGNLLAGMKRYEPAIEHLQKAVELAPEQALPRYNLGRVCLEAGKPDEAASALQKAVEIEPNNPDFHRSLAEALRRMGKPELAAQHIGIAEALEKKAHSPSDGSAVE